MIVKHSNIFYAFFLYDCQFVFICGNSVSFLMSQPEPKSNTEPSFHESMQTVTPFTIKYHDSLKLSLVVL